ncbi:hypothetical protein [Qipengyuania qiaonensis]|uniref:Spore coat protein U domain-containing protein n=1 Tax=Qipengyuania qiaonensis TaxID=2867240 RepID=A0ABS7J7Z9_9SPHN|nr:hypothetical protein [Qipengyuania qiaonensis]MBX7483437.1 hypothetical protein [Qipengyuania qiaonensis]
MCRRLLCQTRAFALRPTSAMLSLVFAVVFAIAAPAFAQSETVTVDISAEIAPRCGFTGSGPAAASAPGDLENAAQLRFGLTLDCNTPFSLGVMATNGELLNQDAMPDGSGFAFAKTYYLTVGIDTDRGFKTSERCASSEIVAGGPCSFASTISGEGLSSGDGIAIDHDAILEVQWPDQRELSRRLAPGRYRDTLILVVGART